MVQTAQIENSQKFVRETNLVCNKTDNPSMISKFHFHRSNFHSLLLQLVLTLKRDFAQAVVLIPVLQHRSNSHGVDGLETQQLKPHSVLSWGALS